MKLELILGIYCSVVTIVLVMTLIGKKEKDTLIKTVYVPSPPDIRVISQHWDDLAKKDMKHFDEVYKLRKTHTITLHNISEALKEEYGISIEQLLKNRELTMLLDKAETLQDEIENPKKGCE